MPLNPNDDGVTHINVYSKGKTQLGRFLSNFFAYGDGTKFETEDGPFLTIEGYWYWLGCKDERLRDTLGFESKRLGRSLGVNDWLDDAQFKRKILFAITCKVLNDPVMSWQLKESTLPLVHYYEYGGNAVEVRQADWIMAYLEHLRNELKAGAA